MGFHVVEKDQPRKHFLLDFGKPFQVSIHGGVEAPNYWSKVLSSMISSFNTWGRGSPQREYVSWFLLSFSVSIHGGVEAPNLFSA